VFTGLFILGMSLLAAPGLALLPRAGLAGVIILVAYGMVDMGSIGRVLRTSSSESTVMLTTFATALLFPLEFAVLSGVIFSLAMHVYRSSMPRVANVVPDNRFRHFVEQPGAPTCPQLAVVNIRGPLFFGATQHVEDTLLRNLAAQPGQRYLLLRMHGVDRCDFTGLEMLESLVRTYRDHGGDVFMVQVRPPVRAIMYESGFKDLLGLDHFLAQEEAIDYLFEAVIDPAVCAYRCPHRVFAECQALLKSPSDAELPPSKPRPIDPEACLSVSQVEGLLGDSAPVVLDVREPGEYRLGHVREARSLPLRLLFPEAPRLPRDRPILLLCRSGRRSRRAMRFLLDLGFEDLWLLKGGILSWKAAGRPLEVD
jgi:SulP family sulfate permease